MTAAKHIKQAVNVFLVLVSKVFSMIASCMRLHLICFGRMLLDSFNLLNMNLLTFSQ